MTYLAKYYSNGIPTATVDLAMGVGATDTVLENTFAPAGWPGGFPYTVAIDRGYPNQEICLVTGQNSTGILLTRNYDNNGAYPHLVGAVVELAVIAEDWNDFNTHNIAQNDDHPNLMLSSGVRHNLTARHQMGTSLLGRAPSPSNVGDIQADGNGTALAYGQHVHMRIDTWATYTQYLLIVGLVIPVVTGFNDSRFLICNGGWYNQSAYPDLFSVIGHNCAPVGLPTSAETYDTGSYDVGYYDTTAVPNPATGPGAGSSPYNPTVHFAVPTLCSYVNNEPEGWYLNTVWAIVANST